MENDLLPDALVAGFTTGSGGGGGGGLSLESQVKFPYIHESRNFLEPLLVTINTYKFTNHGFILICFPDWHALYSGQFTDHEKPLSAPVTNMSLHTEITMIFLCEEGNSLIFTTM